MTYNEPLMYDWSILVALTIVELPCFIVCKVLIVLNLSVNPPPFRPLYQGNGGPDLYLSGCFYTYTSAMEILGGWG